MEASSKRGRKSPSGQFRFGKVRRPLGPFGGQPQSEKVVSATLYNMELNFTRGALALTRLADTTAVDPQIFTTMTPPRTGPGTGSNTLRTLGVEMAVAQTAATATDPYQRNFWGIKIDHPGWNACNPVQWNANVTQFAYVKTSPVVCEILMPDAPVVNSEAVKVIRPGVMNTGQLQLTQQTRFGQINAGTEIWDEIRPLGAWMYIVIPPQKSASINLSVCVGLDRWQQLMQLGYKPRICKGRKYRVLCNPVGFDQAGMTDTSSKLAQLNSSSGIIPVSNGAGTNIPGQYTKVHSAQETDWSVQYDAGAYADSFAGAGTMLQKFSEQGFDVVAFGSAIVFQFCQYAPPTSNTNTSSAAIQNVPITLTVHNKTTFSQLKTASRDIGQVYTLPVVNGV